MVSCGALVLLARSPAAGMVPAHESATFPLAHERWAEMEQAAQRCVPDGGKPGVFGDIEVSIRFRPARVPAVSLKPSARLPPSVVACARRAVIELARGITATLREDVPRSEWSEGESPETYEDVLSLGKARPLIDPAGGLMRRWWHVVERASGAARDDGHARGVGPLPPDVKLTRDLCLEVTSTPRQAESLELWLRAEGERLARFWMTDLDAQVWPEWNASKSIVALSARPFNHHYFFPKGERGFVIYQSAVSAVPTGWLGDMAPYFPANRVCLLPLGPREQTRIEATIDRRGACFAAGASRETLLVPRYSFPADRRYVAVASSGAGQACALDEAGHLTCCGGTPFRSAGTEAFQSLGASSADVCAVGRDGSVSCWSLDRAVRRRLPGVFDSVSVGEAGACGVRRDGTLFCEQPTAPLPTGPFSSVDARAGCGLRRDGAVVCWSDGSPSEDRRNAGSGIIELATNGAASTRGRKSCGRLQTGAIACWGEGIETRPARSGVRYTRLIFNAKNECAMRTDGQLDCWRTESPPPADLGPIQSASLGLPACVVTRQDRIVCWGDDLWNVRQ